MAEGKSGGLSPKIEALPGSLQREWKRCGKPRCRCAHGALHGPYWYRIWRADGRRHKRYVRSTELATVRARLVRWRALHPPAWSVRQELAALRQLEQEVKSQD